MSDLLPDEAGFFRAAQQFIDDYAVEFYAVEIIVWLPELGLAGTIDFIAEIGGRMVIGDWKTRARRHGAYPEEVAQLGAYSLGRHLVAGPFPGVLHDMPEIDALMVVSLKDDGSYAAYPIDLEQARNTAEHMAAAHYGVNDLAAEGTRAIGDPMKGQAPEPTTDLLLPRRREWLRARVRALPVEAKDIAARLWPRDIPKKADVLSHEQIDFVASALDRAEAESGAPFFAPDPATPAPPAGAGKARQPAGAKRTRRSTNKKAEA